jgi:hypothetical protein
VAVHDENKRRALGASDFNIIQFNTYNNAIVSAMSPGWPLAPLTEPRDPYNLRDVDPKVAGIIQQLERQNRKLGFLGDSNFKDLSFGRVARDENLLKYFYEPEKIVGTKQRPPVQAATVQKPAVQKAPARTAPAPKVPVPKAPAPTAPAPKAPVQKPTVQKPPAPKSPAPTVAVVVQTSTAKIPVAPSAPEPMEQEGVDFSVDTGFPSLGASANPDLSPVEDPWVKPPPPQKKILPHKDSASVRGQFCSYHQNFGT